MSEPAPLRSRLCSLLPVRRRPRSPGTAHHPASEARAQALDPGDAMMTPDRERALHECSDASNRFIERDWGVQQDERMASCMMQHGQPM
jgi:hypothetical protein